MGDYRVVTILSCSRGGGSTAPEEFAALLVYSAEDKIEATFTDGGYWTRSYVQFPTVLLSEYADAEEPTEAYAAAVQAHLMDATAFLNRQEIATFDKFCASGLRVYIYLEVRMNQNQMQLNLPVPFLAACARLGLGIEMISNDISAAEAVELGWG